MYECVCGVASQLLLLFRRQKSAFSECTFVIAYVCLVDVAAVAAASAVAVEWMNIPFRMFGGGSSAVCRQQQTEQWQCAHNMVCVPKQCVTLKRGEERHRVCWIEEIDAALAERIVSGSIDPEY